MVSKSQSQSQFLSDIQATSGISLNKAMNLYVAMKNILCHSILEQTMSGTSNEFKINLPPIGYATLYKDENNDWNIKNLEIDTTFELSLNQTLKSNESPLYQQHKDWVNNLIKTQIENISSEL